MRHKSGPEGSAEKTVKVIRRATRVPVNVVSAVGAGDSFVAALAGALINGEDDQTALRFAMAGAGATLMSEGTALFEAATVHQLFSRTS